MWHWRTHLFIWVFLPRGAMSPHCTYCILSDCAPLIQGQRLPFHGSHFFLTQNCQEDWHRFSEEELIFMVVTNASPIPQTLVCYSFEFSPVLEMEIQFGPHNYMFIICQRRQHNDRSWWYNLKLSWPLFQVNIILACLKITHTNAAVVQWLLLYPHEST